MAKEIVGLVMDKSIEELDKIVPDPLFAMINPPCRLEQIRSNTLAQKGITAVLDVCHNPEGMEGTIKEIISKLDEDENLVVLFGASKGKDCTALL